MAQENLPKNDEKAQKDWKLVGKFKNQRAPYVNTSTITVEHLVPETSYKIVLQRDAFGEGDDLEDVEIGERYVATYCIHLRIGVTVGPIQIRFFQPGFKQEAV